MLFRSQYGDGKIVNCNVVIPKYNSETYKYEMWISYDGREDTFCKLEEDSLFKNSNYHFSRNLTKYIK